MLSDCTQTLVAEIRRDAETDNLTARLPGWRGTPFHAADFQTLRASILDTLTALHLQAGTGIKGEDFDVRLRWQASAAPSRPVGHSDQEYIAFISGPVWRLVIRPQVLARANGRCEQCDDTAPLDVHHKTYRNFGGNEDLSDLVAVCRPCHDKRDQFRRGLRTRPAEARYLSESEVQKFAETRRAPEPPVLVPVCPACRAPYDHFGRCVCTSW
jgi:5-methylcytosine-specific restriction endonuclease McrA